MKLRLRQSQFSVQAHQYLYLSFLHHALRKKLLNHTKITHLHDSNNRPLFKTLSRPRPFIGVKYGNQNSWSPFNPSYTTLPTLFIL